MEKVQFRKKGSESNSDPKIIVCIPAYNEENNIVNIIRRARSYVDEIIVCNDGSSDNTAKLAMQEGILVINHPKNYGYGKTIRTLFQTALERRADIVVTIDSDGQHNPEQIPSVIAPILKNGIDIVIGSRFIDQNDKIKIPFYRSFGIKTITKFTKHASYKNLTDSQNLFSAYSRHAVETMNLVEDGMVISTAILMRPGSIKLT